MVTQNNKLLTLGNIKFKINTTLNYSFRMLSLLLNLFLLYLVKRDATLHRIETIPI